jgi:hypothetical protein
MQHEQIGTVSKFIGSRRDALKSAGAVVAIAVVSARRANFANAQESSPAASPVAGEELTGTYVTVRSRTLTVSTNADEAFATIEVGYVPLLREIDGWVAYLGITDPASRQTSFVTICADKAGTDESTRVAGEWLVENGHEFFEGDPVVVEGPIGIAAGSLPMSVGSEATPTSDGSVAEGYVVVRSRKVKPDRSAAELMELIEDGFVPLVEGVTGFIAYLAVANEETRDQFSIGIYSDEAGAHETTSLAVEWGEEGAADFVEGDPIVIEGALAIAAQTR